MKRKPKTPAKPRLARQIIDHRLYEITPRNGLPKLTQVRPSAVIEIEGNTLRVTLDKPNPRIVRGALELGRSDLAAKATFIASPGILKTKGMRDVHISRHVSDSITQALLARVARIVEGALEVYGYATIVQTSF